MNRNGVWRFPEGSGRQGRVERYSCNVICGAPTTSEVKRLRRDEPLFRHFKVSITPLFVDTTKQHFETRVEQFW